nr:zinc ribbon domain-containing protein [Bacteroides intestinalis]
MRCKNCGWDNSDSNIRCEKCNAPLDGSMIEGYQIPKITPQTDSRLLRMTRYENSDETHKTEEEKICPHCGYPSIKEAKVCPNCNTSFEEQKHTSNTGSLTHSFQLHDVKTCTKCQCQNLSSALFCSNCGSQLSGSKETVNPWNGVNSTSMFSLEKLLPIDGQATDNKMFFSGDKVTLNRANTEPQNQTITSKTQAVISKEGDKWYIQDKSELQTTFVQAAHKLEIHTGDVILLGNRKFRFEEK